MKKTLFIGLGGLGQRVVARIKKQAEELKASAEDLRFIAIDSDMDDLKNVAQTAQIPVIPLYQQQNVRSLVNLYHGLGVDAWFPTSPKILHSEGYSTAVRAVGRLGFIHAMETDQLQKIQEQLLALFDGHWPDEKELQIVVATSLAGGIGSGSFIQLALWLRKKVWELWNFSCDICGVFAGPEVFIRSHGLGVSISEQQRANACAALRELEAFTKSAETGQLVPGYDAFTLDGLQLARTGPRPIYDRISIYESSEAVSFERHLDRMAQGALLYYTSGKADARFLTVGSALARYPEKEIVEYCSLRGAMELQQKNWQSPGDLAEAQVDEVVNRLLKALERLIDDGLQGPQQALTQMSPIPETISNKEMENFIMHLLREMEKWLKRYYNEIEDLAPVLCTRIIKRHSAEGDYQYAPLFRLPNQAGVLPPASLKAVLEKLKFRLHAIRVRAQEQVRVSPTARHWLPGREEVPPPEGFRTVTAVDSELYPLSVWKRSIPMIKVMFGKKFTEWLLYYREACMELHKKRARAMLVDALFEKLISELEGLQSTMALFDGRVGMCLDRLFEKHNEQENAAAEYLIGTNEGIKQRIYEQLSLTDDWKQMADCYLKNLLALHAEQRWQGLGGIERHLEHRITVACKDLLQQIKDSVLSSGSDLIHMEATEAVQFCGMHTNALQRLCEAMYKQSVAGAAGVGGDKATDVADRQVIFGVSEACKNKIEMDVIVKALAFAQLLEVHGMDRAVLWCLCVERGSAPMTSIMARYAEAYNWLCRRARNAGEAHFEPHLDKRWSGQLFGLE